MPQQVIVSILGDYNTYFGSKADSTAHKPQPWSPGAPQFKFELSVPSIQAQSRLIAEAGLDCDAPTQKVEPDTVREKAYRPLVLDEPAIVNRCEFTGQAIIKFVQLDASAAAVPLSFKHDAWPSEPSLSL